MEQILKCGRELLNNLKKFQNFNYAECGRERHGALRTEQGMVGKASLRRFDGEILSQI